MSDLLETLKEQVLTDAPWEAIEPHITRGVILYVDGLSLPEAGLPIAEDDVPAVEALLGDGSLRRPTPDDIATWSDAEPLFHMLVVQPWILVTLQSD